MNNRFFKRFGIVMIMILAAMYWTGSIHAENADTILEKIDGYREIGGDFSMNIKIADYENDKLNEEATFRATSPGTIKAC